ncbi:universal stress protein [Mycetohabitans sp. B5]|uniref:Nucleotide-binding universal stress UspA family protein n=1 Tax=Mycetohabitans endofungorum TaxID=417203 RepID=A0A2P5K846_9BURK|nr:MULTISPECIES: universal stress protein [Mycetohabitans]MCG1055388.1 universal stress protein [Mycetohabitans sp. B5]PPB82891.1 nucleotide-binding universal stress UspA family protein [Mycetohabitans endofungorum]
MYHRILVAIDGSHTSRHAFNAALDLAASEGAQLQPVFVVDDVPLYYSVPGYDPSIVMRAQTEEGQRVIDEAADAMRARGITGTPQILTTSSFEGIAECIVQAAQAFNADLLVLGTHGRRGVRRLLLGSVAEQTLRLAQLPVLLIPSTSHVPQAAPSTTANG